MTNKSIFHSDVSEHRWVDQITRHFDKEVAIDIGDIPVSVFSVPRSISAFKPEAYVPQVMALGPYHHFRPELYQMERYKLATVKALLRPDQVENFHPLLIDRLRVLEPEIRACYHKYMDLDDDTIAWVVAIDGLFLIHLLRDYASPAFLKGKWKVKPKGALYGDLMVLENQIPVVLLKEIRKSLGRPDSDDADLFNMMKGYCHVHSPLKLAKKSSDRREPTHLHLLDLMYLSIVEHRETKLANHEEFPKIRETSPHPVQVIKNMPWDKMSNLLGLAAHNTTGENVSSIQEISIPSVSNLYHYGGINFSHTIGGIRDIKFDESEATLYLPFITINSNTEVILRNLVAYESATSNSTLVLAHYVDLMCGMIDTVEDVVLLKEKGIIKGDLSNKEIANLFNGINMSTGNESSKIIEEINAYYNRKPIVKTYRIVKRRAYKSWKVLTLVSSIMLLLLLTMHSFCQDYGCPHFLGTG